MQRALIVINNPRRRAQAESLLARVPWGTRVEFKASKRTIPQNAKMWAMLTDISRQLDWGGKRRTVDEWKKLFLDALPRETEMVPNLTGDGHVSLQGSSDLTKGEMIDLIELIYKFGAEHGIE